MKVVCESCQAKYQVPDERVAGKKLKIRCKRCGATVLIRGDLIDNGAPQTGPAYERPSIAESLAPIETATRDQDAGYEWHVSLDGDTRGPYSTDDLRDWLNNTPGGWDAHVWREGFPDWIDARACAELEPPPAPPAIASLQQEDELPTQTFQQHSSQFLQDVAAPRSSTATSLGMQPSMQRSRAPSGMAEPGLGDEGFFSSSGGLAAMAAPSYPSASPAPSASSTSTATGLGSIAASSPAYIPGPNPGFANGEGSGLIDIRALASLARQSTTQIAKGPGVSAAASSAVPKGSISETQLSYGSDDDEARVALANQPTGFGRLDSLAPVAHTPTSNAALPLAILGGCALVAAAVLAAVLFTRPNRPAEVVSTPVSKEVQDSRAATSQPPNGLEGEAQDKKPEPPAPAPAKEPKEPTPGPGSSAAPVGEPHELHEQPHENEDELAAAKKRKPLAPRSAAEDEKNTNSPDEKAKPKKEEKPSQQDSPEVMLASQAKPIRQSPPTPPPAAPAMASAAAAPAAAEPPKSGAAIDSLLDGKSAAKPQQAAQVQPPKNRSIDDLLNGADKPAAAPAAPAPKPATPAPAAAAAEEGANDLPEAPSRDEVLAAMRGVESAVRACVAGEQPTGTAEVALSVAGDTGRVTSANVTGITGSAGTCIARAVRNARFPHFTKPVFSIKYPYHF